ncbi:hypothetical protein IT397_02965 [Candidatus Nomurabacteria bacterium]|nr:hypothetical protein [Candidatus Nomurabacteria bacterium]
MEYYGNSQFGEPESKAWMVRMLIKYGLAKNEAQGNIILIGVIVVCTVGTIWINFF